MTNVITQTVTPEEVVSLALAQMNQGQIEDVIHLFADRFQFTDHGIGLEFTDKERLTEFFRKTRDLYPDFLLQPAHTFVSGEHVIIQWTLQVRMSERFYAGLSRRVSVLVNGISIVRVSDGRIASWADYYDGLTSRRTALAGHFTEWIEY